MKANNFKDRQVMALKNGRASLIVVRNGRVLSRAKSDGVRDLVWCSRSGLLVGAQIFDLKIGLAAAKLAIWSGCRSLFALQASNAAVEFTKRAKVKIDFESRTKKIGDCQLEKAALGAKNLKELQEQLENLITVRFEAAPADGIFPLNYFTTSNRRMAVNLAGTWVDVSRPEMDKGILIDPERKTAQCLATGEVKKGDLIAVGELGQGIKEVVNTHTAKTEFGFMGSQVSAERSKEILISKVAQKIVAVKKQGGRVLFVLGPAVVHTGSGRYLAKLIRKGYVDVIFGGNAVAAHDLEENYLGTSLGINLATGNATPGGNHNHLRTINAVRYFGGIKNFVDHSQVKRGIFYECVRNGTKFVLAGSIRDDGPITDVITNTVAAQAAMRAETRRGFGLAIMVATTLHSIATGNLLSEATPKIIVDDNLAVVTKLADRGTSATGIVTDCAYFLSELCRQLKI
jgi:lysine-ketoglutarate reductase/saccharopine dehydrogenase-like protein (TIGR00300 family)